MSKKRSSPLSDPPYKSNPYPVYAQMRGETPAYPTTLPNGVAVYLVTRYADVLAGLKDDRLVKNIRNARPLGWPSKLGYSTRPACGVIISPKPRSICMLTRAWPRWPRKRTRTPRYSACSVIASPLTLAGSKTRPSASTLWTQMAAPLSLQF